MTVLVETETDAERQATRISYSSKDQKPLPRMMVRAIETVTGRNKIESMYRNWSENPPPGETLFEAAVRLLDIRLKVDEAALAAIPRTGPVLFVANHPFGVVDGLIMGFLASRVRPDVKIMTTSVLCQAKEARPYLLPVDFGGTPEAALRTVDTRRRAVDWLAKDGAVVIFPGGGVATSQRPLKGPALDLPWHPFAGKLARMPGVRIVPVYFHGQNSRLFQIASHVSYSLRIGLLFRESLRMKGTELKVSIGSPITAESLPKSGDRNSLINAIRAQTFALASGDAAVSSEPYIWPERIRWN